MEGPFEESGEGAERTASHPSCSRRPHNERRWKATHTGPALPEYAEGEGEAAGVVSVLAEAARSEGALSMRAMETTPAVSQAKNNEQA